MKNTIIGFFCLGAVAANFSLPSFVYAQIGGQTYQRVKASTAPETSAPVEKETKKHNKKKKIEDSWSRLLTVDEDEELTFPAGLKECKVYDSKSLERAILRAIWKGECEWIVLRSSSDWDPNAPLWLEMDKPIVIEDKHPLAKGHPLVITNDTGRAIVFRTPKNGGCTIIMNKPDVAILGFTFEGAICR